MFYALMIAYGFVGLVIGSFLNVVIDRVPAKESLLHPPSHCPACGRRLAPPDMVPILSYLILRGRCRTCGARIPARILIVEIMTPLLFLLLLWLYGPTLQTLLYTFYCCVLLAIMVIDLDHMIIPNAISLPATGVALAVVPLNAWGAQPLFVYYGFLWLWRTSHGKPRLSPSLLSAYGQILGGVVALAIFAILWFAVLKLARVEAMGFGDVKLAAFCGLITGYPAVLLVIAGSFILGGMTATVLLLTGRAGRKTPIPFAPFMVVATFFVLIFGEPILRWWLGYG